MDYREPVPKMIFSVKGNERGVWPTFFSGLDISFRVKFEKAQAKYSSKHIDR